MGHIVNLSAYRFVHIDETELPALRQSLRAKALKLEIKGTILLGTEGINLFVAGECDAIEQFKAFLNQDTRFADLFYKESLSDERPFTRMLVRIKKEIIPMGIEAIQPEKQTAPHLAPEKLKQWYDEGRDMVVLDTRNDYEVRLGAFDDAVDLDIKHFRDFPAALAKLPESAKKKPVVTYCTGGIRCEKAAELMSQAGFEEVYQLDGGIINYFEKCAGDHYHGECFVFDKRVALDPELKETKTVQCYACRNPITLDELSAAKNSCPYCEQEGLLG